MNIVRMRPYCSGTTNLIATDLKNHRIKSVKSFAFYKGKTPTQLYQCCADQLYNFCHGQARYMLNWTDAQVEESSLRLASGLVELGNQLKEEEQGTILNIASLMVQKHDLITSWHQSRVAILSCLIGRKLLQNGSELRNLSWAAGMHDFGKVFIPIEILKKDGPWNDQEDQYKKLHVLTAFCIFNSIPYLKGVAEIIGNHHFFDGYTIIDGLPSISLATEILSAVDYFDAMLFPRSYHNGHEPEEIMEELEARKYKPEIIELIKQYSSVPV